MDKKNVRISNLGKGVLLAVLAISLLVQPLCVREAKADSAADARDLTEECTIYLPENSAGFVSRFTDGRYDSRVSFTAKQMLTLDVPDGAAGLYIAWYTAPESCIVESLDEIGNVLRAAAVNPDLLNGYYALPGNCASVRISGERAFAVSELGVYDAETPPEALCIMTAQKAQPKVMLVMTHTGDEAYNFGSLLPFCSSEDVACVFIMARSRTAQQQTIEMQYALGSRTQPIFAGFQYFRSYTDNTGMYAVIDKQEISTYMLRLLRRYRPETLVTHADDGENGDCTHAMTALHVLLAVTQAASETKDYESLTKYGPWQVSAVYQHALQGTAPLYDTSAALGGYDGLSAVELAQACFDRYTFLQVYHADVSDTPYFIRTYPESAGVSEEESAERLLSLLESTAAETEPLATVSPEPTATPEPTAEPTATPEAETAAEELDFSAFVLPVGVSLLVLGTALAGCYFSLRRKEEKKKAIRILCACAAVLLLLAGTALVVRTLFSPDEIEAEQTPTPAATDTAAPEPTAVVEATPTPHPFTGHFRQEDDPEEVVVFDADNGIYEYHSDTLGIEIRRVTKTDPPLVYFVAHIYMRDVDAYRSGFGSARQNGRDPLDACTMARRYRAVLGITGDNLMHSEYNRGLFIRDGRVFRSMTAVPVMVLTDDLSMRIYQKEDRTMLNEIEDGAQTTYAFGPALIIDGELCENVDEDRVGWRNPRAGLGLVEPGHFVAIVVDGRLSGYSHGVILSEYAQIFKDENCVMAYNLDGGASATMVFMGEYLNLRSEKHYRRVPDQLLWGYSELVPAEDDPRVYSGTVEYLYD